MVRKIRSRTFRAKRNADMANSIDILDYLESKMFEERDYKHIKSRITPICIKVSHNGYMG